MEANVEASAYEGEIEYDRLHTAVSWAQVEAYAHRLHSAQTHPLGGPKLRHCYAVAELARRHAAVLFAEADFFSQRYHALVCRAGGLLHEAADYGAYFEDLVTAADEAVAQLVTSVSVDRRVPRPRRLRLYGNQVGLAPPAAQLIKLADLQHDCLLLREAGDHPLLRAWLEEAREVTSCLGRIQSVAALKAQVRQLKTDLQDLDQQRRQRG